MLEVVDVDLKGAEPAGEGFAHTFLPGEITVVLGANQSGKTDLCRLIAGLNTRATGRVWLDRQEISQLDSRRRSVSMVYQAFINYPNLTVAQNIGSPLRAQGIELPAREARVADIAERLSIQDYLGRFPHELSGGQQQRVAIARALAKQARVLLLDEPLVNLDFKLREALEVELRDLLHASNTVVVYTSSDPRDAFSLGDQLLLLDGGKKLQSGKPIDVYRQPLDARAMGLLADPCINELKHEAREGALRPEHVFFADDLALRGRSCIAFELTVIACETNGDESFVHGEVAGAQWVMRCDGIRRPRLGSRVSVKALEQDVIWF
mgnify:CR=1 FL=1